MYFRTVLILATVACLRADPVQLQSSTLQVAVSANMATLQLNTRPTLAVGYYAVVGGEFTLIRAFNGAQLTVSRAQAGTVGMAHAIGTVAWIAPSGATISADPVGACLRSTMPYAPVLSYATGSAWDCIGSVWTVVTPGFYDSGLPGYRNIRGTAAVRATTACDIGDKYFTTDSVAGENLYGCTATNTWTLLSGGSSGNVITIPGVWNNTAWTLGQTVTVNGGSSQTIIQAQQGAGQYTTDGVGVGMIIPSTSTNWEGGGISGALVNRSVVTNGVAVRGYAIGGAAGTGTPDAQRVRVWSRNGLCSDGGFANVYCLNEDDFNVTVSGTKVIAESIGGASTASPSAGSAGYVCNTLGVGIKWPLCYASLDGVSDYSISIGKKLASGTSESQFFTTYSERSGGIQGQGFLYMDNFNSIVLHGGDIGGGKDAKLTNDGYFIPNADLDGQLGTASFRWNIGFIDSLRGRGALLTAVAAPSTPASGIGAVYVDSTSKNLAVKDDAGVVKHGIQDATCTGQFISAISAAGVSTCTTASTTLGNEVTKVNGTTITVSASDAQGFANGTGPTSTTTLATFTIDTRVITAIADLGGSPKQTRITFGTAWPTTTLAIAEVLGIGSAAGTGCTGLNNLFTVQDRSDTTHADIIYDSTGCTYTGSSATAGQNAAATGYVYFAGDDAATVQVQVPSGSGLILTSTGGPTTINQTLSPTYGGVPFGAVGITAGAFSGTAINARTAMRTSPVFAGNSGISVIQGITGTTVSTTADVMSKSGTNTITGSITADNASAIRPIKQVSADPGTCTVGEAILNTTSHVAKDCTQTNTLTARGGSSGTSVHHITGMAGGAVAGPGTGVSGVFYCGAGCTIDPNAVAGTIQYADSVSDLDGYLDVVLPSTFAGTVDLVIWFYNNASAGTNIDLSSATGCYAVGDTLNGAPSFNADTSVTVASGASGAAVKATFANIATTNCAAGELMKVRLRREGGDAFTGFVDVSAVDFSLTY